MTERILVIKLGALGDLVLCAGAFAAVRRHHTQAKIALLTAPAFEGFARLMPWFDEVLTDPRPRATEVRAWAKLVRDVRAFGPSRVYDFQGKTRQTILYNLLGGPWAGPEWSGAAPGCSHPRAWPPEAGMSYTAFLAAQLARAGVEMGAPPTLDWLDGPVDDMNVPLRFALLIPGCAPDRPYKRWPADNYAALAARFEAEGISCLAVGTKADEDAIAAIREKAPFVISLAGKTSLPRLGGLARRAACVIGNDTGPTHLAAAVGAKTVALMSDRVNPTWSAPQGPKTVWIQGHPLETLSVDDVWRAIKGG